MPSPARQQRSRALVMNTIAERDGLTRAELGRVTGLSRSAVTDIVRGLVDDGLVREEQLSASESGRRGRPSSLLVLAHPDGVVAGVDFGHAHVAAALAHTSGEVLDRTREAVDVDGHAVAALDLASTLTQRLLARAGIGPDELLAVSAGLPGPIDVLTDTVGSPTIMSSWTGLDPAAELGRRLGTRVVVGNDANMGALGEMRYGAARGFRDFVYVKASSGIGAGLVLGGQVYRGSRGTAGEIGHTQLPEAGNWCRCGNRGCLESVVSMTHVHEQIAQLGLASGDAGLADAGEHPTVSRIVREAGRTIGRVLADLCNSLDPAALVLGGELGTVGEPLVAGVRESVERYAQPATAHTVVIRSAGLGLDSELYGAVAHAAQRAARPWETGAPA